MKAGNEDALQAVEEYYPACVNTAIATPSAGGDIRKVEFFSPDGTRLSSPQKGVNVRRTTFSNGQRKSEKIAL